MLRQSFANLFSSEEARERLAEIAGQAHLHLPTFALVTSSLRHAQQWFKRLQDISDGVIREHGNFVADPASIGLVRRTTGDPKLSPVGKVLLSKKEAIARDPERAEYELVKALYF